MLKSEAPETKPSAGARGRSGLRALGGEPGPLYAGVKQMILTRIQSGEWAPNARVPSENELVAELGVSRMTANRALRELASVGVLIRIQGVGSFVAERKGHSALVEVRNIAEEIKARGHAHTAEVIVLQEETASPEVADALDIPIGEPVFHSVIVHHENDVPVQLEDRFVNPAAAPIISRRISRDDAERLSHPRRAARRGRARRRGHPAGAVGMQAPRRRPRRAVPDDPPPHLVGGDERHRRPSCLSGGRYRLEGRFSARADG